MKLTSILPYFGGKRTLAPTIIRELGEHRAYFEPFCGSLAVLLVKPPVAFETVNDLHGDVINLAMVLASDRWHELYQKVDRVLLCEEVISSFKRECSSDFTPPDGPRDVKKHHCDRAAHYMGLSWIARNGVSGTKRVNYQISARWTQGGGSPGIRWRSAVDSVPAWHDRLKAVVIMRRDAFDILGKIADEPGTAIYVDPPYLKSTRGSGGGSRYLYDFGEAAGWLLDPIDDHERLAVALRRFRKARVVVSYYDDPRLDPLYVAHGWTLVRHYRSKNLAQQNKRGVDGRTKAPEVLITNGPSEWA